MPAAMHHHEFHLHPTEILREMQNLRGERAARLVLQGTLVGGATGAIIGLFRVFYGWSNAFFAHMAAQAPGSPEFIPIFFVILLLLALGTGWMVRKEPLVSGSGIPQMELAMLGQLPFPWLRIIVFKFFGTLMSLSGGISVGCGGPSIQLGAAVGSGFGHLFRQIFGRRVGGPPRFLLAGMVAGLTAAFGAPLAGMLFAFEEAKTIVSAPLLLFTGVAAASAWFVVDILFGFGFFFPLSNISALEWPSVWMAIPAGILLGALGALFNKMLLCITRMHDRQKLVPPILKPILPFMLAGIFVFVYPDVLVGVGISTLDLAGGGGSLQNPGQMFSMTALLLLVLTKGGFTIFSFASGVPGGLFMPIIALGGMSGALIGTVVGSPLFLGPAATNMPVFVVLGMTGLVAGSIRTPLTAVALITEMTGAPQCLPEMCLVTICSIYTANFLGASPVYKMLKIRFLELRKAK